MLEIYFYILGGSVLLAVLYVLLGDLISQVLDGFINPLLLIGFFAVFSGSAILFTIFTKIDPLWIALLSALIAFVVTVFLNVFIVKPMERTEASTGYSRNELEGKAAVVIVPIPEKGFGEVMVNVAGSRNTYRAKSYDQVPIAAKEEVIIMKEDSGTLTVLKLKPYEGVIV